MNNEEPRKKRKYTKKSKMLLRSNYDYIDHDYWPKVYKEWEGTRQNIEAKYGVKAKEIVQHIYTPSEKKELNKQGIGKVIIIEEIKSGPLFKLPIVDK
jgi:hypothetical protein